MSFRPMGACLWPARGAIGATASIHPSAFSSDDRVLRYQGYVADIVELPFDRPVVNSWHHVWRVFWLIRCTWWSRTKWLFLLKNVVDFSTPVYVSGGQFGGLRGG